MGIFRNFEGRKLLNITLMKLLFNVEYHTNFGEYLVLNLVPEDASAKVSQHKMTTLDGEHWFVELTKTLKAGSTVNYYYSVVRGDDEYRHEWLV
jgi:4-alpha-glucanotransferase